MTIIDDLIRDEGLRLKPYRDTAGKLTIGVGRNLDDIGITDAEARVLLANDLQQVWNDLRVDCPWHFKLDAARDAALCNMCFNLGITRLLTFTKMLAALKAGDWQTAHDEALASTWARQVGQRAERIAATFKSGTNSDPT